jgi:hypothetical protein
MNAIDDDRELLITADAILLDNDFTDYSVIYYKEIADYYNFQDILSFLDAELRQYPSIRITLIELEPNVYNLHLHEPYGGQILSDANIKILMDQAVNSYIDDID